MSESVRLVTKTLDEVDVAAYNPRRIDNEALDGLKGSVQRFGLVQPIIWNERTNRVVGGHQRLRAIQELGHKVAQFLVVDLSETEEKALNLALNNPGTQGKFVGSELSQLLDGLRGFEGFDDMNLGSLDELATDLMENELERGAGDFEFDSAFNPENVVLKEAKAKKEVQCPSCGTKFSPKT